MESFQMPIPDRIKARGGNGINPDYTIESFVIPIGGFLKVFKGAKNVGNGVRVNQKIGNVVKELKEYSRGKSFESTARVHLKELGILQ